MQCHVPRNLKWCTYEQGSCGDGREELHAAASSLGAVTEFSNANADSRGQNEGHEAESEEAARLDDDGALPWNKVIVTTCHLV